MASVVQKNFRIRNSFGQIDKVIDIPNLIDIQKQSYVQFLQWMYRQTSEETSDCRVYSRVFSPSKISTKRARLSLFHTT